MAFLHNIRTVALYEAKTLRRSWFFRLFALGVLFIFTIWNIVLFSPIGEEGWEFISIASSVPLINLYLLNIGQAFVVIFLAADFLKRDKKLDTNEVLYTRSMSNLEYIIGKTWGILRLFLGLNIVVLAMGMLANIISTTMTIDYMSYIAYLLIFSVPTLVFSLGLAFVIMSLIRNQAVTFLVLLGYAALNIFYLWYRMGNIFDYMAFGMPVFKSSIIGFDNLSDIVSQRLMYFFAGMALVLATVLLFKRLPQSRIQRVFTIILMIIFAAGSGIAGYKSYTTYTRIREFKKSVVDTNRKYENQNFATITDAEISFIHKGKSFEATANITINNKNATALSRYLFSLNPSLSVQKITSGGNDLKYSRINQIIETDPGKNLDPGMSDSILITYSGTIDEAFCYPNYVDNKKTTPYMIAMVNINKRQSFLDDKYVLLTPETHWYPVSGLNYYPTNPAKIKLDFTRYTLRVKTDPGLTAIAQGKMTTENGYNTFRSESPLSGLTLVMGSYQSDTLRVDSIDYISFYFPGHDYYKKDLSELKDTLPSLISGLMRELETNFSTRYPYKTLSLVEVPIQFYSFPKKNTQTRAEVQPSMVLLPEKLSTIENAGFAKRFKNQKRRMARNNEVITDKELEVRIFNECIRNVFISGENYQWRNGILLNEPTRYRLGPSFYFFKNNFYSSEYPVINAVFESHLQHLTTIDENNDFRTGMGVLSDNDKANIILRNISFSELLSKNPSWDTIRNVLTVKGDWLFNLLRSKAGITDFKPWFSEYIDKNQFKNIDIQKFDNDIKEKFGFDFIPMLDSWFNSKDQPGFLFSNLRATEIVINDRSRFQVTFIATNPEPVAGLFNVSFNTGEKTVSDERINLSQMGRGMDAEEISRIIFLGPREAKRIGIVLDAEPRTMRVNTLVAKNIPGEIELPFNEIFKARNENKEFSGEETLSSMPAFSDPSEIIIDNEDSGFSSSKENTTSPLKTFLGVKNRNGDTYLKISTWNTPQIWQPVVLTSYFGKYIRSAVYTRSGSGDKTLTWQTPLTDKGYYDIYCYIGKTINRLQVSGGDEGDGIDFDRNNQFKDLHFNVYHDEGIDDITIEYDQAEGGWNNLGRFYLTKDSAKVVLTNKSAGRMVIGDAIKWVKQN